MLTDQRIPLDGQWKLYYAENKRVHRELDEDALLTEEILCAHSYPSVAAAVPGNFELDLQAAGLIDEPFYACNTIRLQKLENLHLFYTRRFTLDTVDENTYLTFEGIDTVADIFVNGQLLGKTDNMLIPFSFCGKKLLHAGENEILVHITPAHIAARSYPLEAGGRHVRIGADAMFIRKAPHMYGWDIMPRALSGGIWRSCYVEQKRPDRIDDVFVYTHNLDLAANKATFGFVWNATVAEDDLSQYRLTIVGECGESRFEYRYPRLWHTGDYLYLHIDDPKLWYPRNYGEPDLYDITFTLYYRDEAVYEYKVSAGLRTIHLDRTSVTDKDGNGEFLFTVNGKKVFWQGTNWVPVDAYHSRDKERLPAILPMLNDLNCNCVRCWGGNVYEDDSFYDYCDRNGIMVWQDFAHACAINPQTDDYAARFGREVEVTVKRLRNHTSIILWAGDNEVDACYQWERNYINRDPNSNRLTREVIPKELNAHDHTRPYLPSSPYMDPEAYHITRKEPTEKFISEDHLWGPRDYFKGEFYSTSCAHFASETGYHGCPSPDSLKKFIRPEQLWHWKKYPGDPQRARIPQDDWTCHAATAALEDEDDYFYRIGLMSDQVKTLFVNFREDEAAQGLDRFAKASQISQAEAKKYFIERFRLSKWRRTGIIWWNLIDGWPQISDAVVDYYGSKKLAYHYIKRSQAQFCMMFDEPQDGAISLYAVSDLQRTASFTYRVTELSTGRITAEGKGELAENTSVAVCKMPIDPNGKEFYLIEWQVTSPDGSVTGKNHYVTNAIDLDLDTYLTRMEQAGFANEFEGF